ncbi:methyltransferase domain-containing protein [Maribacter sp. R77961]|uniref:methyltransferase domain-containing protein n=1 Tax=Maribacter sp. R77961 TaxID=3093871 RepID=UPI0037C5DAEB
MENQQDYWTTRYKNQSTGWDIGYPSTPLKDYINQLHEKTISILIPGAGNAYEAEYLWKNGFKNIYILDISQVPLIAFQERIPDFPPKQLLRGDFFEHQGKYDLILEQTFFCSFVPTDENRHRYAKKMAGLLAATGKLVGVWFNFPLTGDMEKRPFGGNKNLYLSYLETYLKTITFKACYNSIPPRRGKELFGIFMKK